MKYLFLFFLSFMFFNSYSQIKKFALVTTSKFSPLLIREIEHRVLQMYGISVEPKLDSFALHDHDAQEAAKTVNKLNFSSTYRGTIALTKKAIFAGTWFFPEEVYGYTEDSSCIISDYLVKQNSLRYNNRVTHTVLHEVGHIVGLDHCENGKCLMYCCGHIDNKYLCDKCKQILKQKTQ